MRGVITIGEVLPFINELEFTLQISAKSVSPQLDKHRVVREVRLDIRDKGHRDPQKRTFRVTLESLMRWRRSSIPIDMSVTSLVKSRYPSVLEMYERVEQPTAASIGCWETLSMPRHLLLRLLSGLFQPRSFLRRPDAFIFD